MAGFVLFCFSTIYLSFPFLLRAVYNSNVKYLVRYLPDFLQNRCWIVFEISLINSLESKHV